jgi:hypothetical protein
VTFKQQAACVEGQMRKRFSLFEFAKLKGFFGQTAQLPAFSAAGLGFTVYIVAVIKDDVTPFTLCCCMQDRLPEQGA